MFKFNYFRFKKYTISVVLHGGMGNQLFQFFIACLEVGSNKFSVLLVSHGFIDNYQARRKLEVNPFIAAHEKNITIRKIHSNFFLKLRLPKVLKYISCVERILHIPFYGTVLDGYFQELKFFNDYPKKHVSQLVIKWRRALFRDGLLQGASKCNLLHIRLTDFFQSTFSAEEFVRYRLINLDSDTDIVTDDETLVLKELSKLNLLFRVDVIKTLNFSAWELFSLMSKYKTLETNGSSLAFWVAVLAGSNLITSNLEHQKIYDYLKKEINF
jgi:hypothetical protein